MGYIASKKKENSIGQIAISTSVFESIAANALEDLKDVKVMNGLHLRKLISCHAENNNIYINANVRVRNGMNVSELSSRAQNMIRNAIVQMTDYTNVVVNVIVKGFFK